METVSMNCSLTTVSISFLVPFNPVAMSQLELENKSVFVDEIQVYGYDGVHKSPEFSPLEFSQIEIKYSHFCLALQFQVSSICHGTQPGWGSSVRVGVYHPVSTV